MSGRAAHRLQITYRGTQLTRASSNCTNFRLERELEYVYNSSFLIRCNKRHQYPVCTNAIQVSNTPVFVHRHEISAVFCFSAFAVCRGGEGHATGADVGKVVVTSPSPSLLLSPSLQLSLSTTWTSTSHCRFSRLKEESGPKQDFRWATLLRRNGGLRALTRRPRPCTNGLLASRFFRNFAAPGGRWLQLSLDSDGLSVCFFARHQEKSSAQHSRGTRV